MRKPIVLPLVVILLALLSATQPARAASAEVVDQAGFFSPEAVARANQDLADIHQQYGRDLRIETFPSIPSDLQSRFNPQRKAEFFSQWAYDRAKAAGVKGALVLITREPSYLQVVVGEETRQRAFTPADRDRLRDTMLTAFKQKRYDEGLLQGISVFRQALEAHGASAAVTPAAPGAPAPAAPYGGAASPRQDSPVLAPRPSFSMGRMLFWVALIALGIFLIRRMFSRRTAGYQTANPNYNQPTNPNAYPPNNQPGYGGGGGFGRGVGGGILGGLLGGWLGNRVFGSSHQAYGAPPPPPTDQGGGGLFSDQAHQQDFMADQGGFQDLGGGGDFGGGGDAGGGGGGDAGGGGDF